MRLTKWEMVQKRVIEMSIKENKNDLNRVSRDIGISVPTLYRKIKRMHIARKFSRHH